MTKAVHVQAAIGSKDPVKETEWLQAAADRTGFPHGIVAHADLRAPDVEIVLERHCEYPNMRGIRDFSYGDYLVEPDFHRGFALLEKYNLVPSMAAQWQDMEKLRDLAGRFPNIIIVVDHTGFPEERSDEYFRKWKRGMAVAAEADNVRCKISGLGMGDNNWTVASIRPYVLHSIETFGVERCFFATKLARRLAVELLRRRRRRLHRDHRRLHSRGAGGHVLEERRRALQNLNGLWHASPAAWAAAIDVGRVRCRSLSGREILKPQVRVEAPLRETLSATRQQPDRGRRYQYPESPCNPGRYDMSCGSHLAEPTRPARLREVVRP